MRPILTAVIAAIEASAIALAGLIAVVIPAFALWLVSFEMAAEPVTVFGGSASVWLLAHLIPLDFRISPEVALSYGLPPEAVEFSVSLAPLGITLITVLLALRAGLRFARHGGAGIAGVVGGVGGFAALATGVSQFALATDSTPVWAVFLVSGAVYGISALASFLTRAAIDQHAWWRSVRQFVLQRLFRVSVVSVEKLSAAASVTLRLAGSSVAVIVAASAIGVAVAIIAGYIDIISLTQALQLDVLGAVVVFLVQLVCIPIACVWGVAWLSGAGFALGAGSSVSPFGTMTGPLPSLPLLGAIPSGWGNAAVLAPALIIVLTLGVGVLVARLSELRDMGIVALCTVPVAAAVLAGLAVTGLSFLAVGSVGPDRLSMVGPQPWVVGGLISAEVAAGLLLGVVAGRWDRERLMSIIPSFDRDADPIAESNYLSVSKSPSRESLFRSVSRRKKTRPSLQTRTNSEPFEELPEVDALTHEPLSGELFEQQATTSESTAADGQETEPITEIRPPSYPLNDGSQTDLSESSEEPSGVEELSAEEEEELLRAYSWDQAPEQPRPERPRWRLPRRKD